jgi:hypothetical protein
MSIYPFQLYVIPAKISYGQNLNRYACYIIDACTTFGLLWQ